jgi:ADP-L-glycero-D-manno-heptose 6-epimerase
MKDRNALIVVTGAAGFIGSCMVGYLNSMGFENIVIVDKFTTPDKIPNTAKKKFSNTIDRDIFFSWLKTSELQIDFIFHLGARTDTTEFDYSIHEKLNVEYSKKIWQYCVEKKIPLVYASSAATYGSGESGYKDDHDIVSKLQPLNPYGISKNEFDKWALKQKQSPPFWAGLKFFNVYGPNEYHKNRMASVIWHSYNQIRKNGKVKLFKSHNPEFKDGEQLRDFIYVKDVINICYWFMEKSRGDGKLPASGLYNVGTGRARTFNQLVKNIFNALNSEPSIEYIDTPMEIRDKYQYFTEADITKLRNAGYHEEFYSLEEGVSNYVKEFLIGKKYY